MGQRGTPGPIARRLRVLPVLMKIPAFVDGSLKLELKIVSIVFFTFVCYLAVGLPIAVLPGRITGSLGYSPFMAGVVMSAQYIATLASRPLTGRLVDLRGPKHAAVAGLLACVLSAALYLVSTLFQGPSTQLALLFLARLLLGFGESMVSTGAITWGIGAVGPGHTAKVISWNGIANYSGLALGAPLGVALASVGGFAVVALLIGLASAAALYVAWRKPAVAIASGERLPYHRVVGQVTPHGLILALGAAGFGALATFVTLYYASRGWSGAATSLTVFGACFILTRLVFSNAVRRHGGFMVAIVSLCVETLGLFSVTLAPSTLGAWIGCGLAGAGFALLFPSLGVEAVKHVPPASRGSAIGAYSAFLDLSLCLTGPLAGLLARWLGYGSIFFAVGLGCAGGALLAWRLRQREILRSAQAG